VQENHHCALTFQLLRTSGNLLGRFSERAEWQAARRLLVDAILSTDMHGHFALTQELQKHGPVFSPDVEADRALLVGLCGGRRASWLHGRMTGRWCCLLRS
jgi:hypothetical protein